MENGRWFWWLLIGIFLLDNLLVILHIGVPREPMDNQLAAFTNVAQWLLVSGIAYYGLR